MCTSVEILGKFRLIFSKSTSHHLLKPLFLRIETSAGHGAGKPTSKLLEEAADALSFMLYNMKVLAIYDSMKN